VTKRFVPPRGDLDAAWGCDSGGEVGDGATRG
jgi:hypothetical protein